MLLSLFRDSDVNLMIDPSITATATFDVKNTTVEEAFEAVLRSADLAYEWDGSFLRVRPLERQIFDVDVPNNTGVAIGQQAGANAAAGGGAGAGAGGGAGEADPWSRIESDVTQLVSEPGLVLVNEMAGTVTVEASPSSVERVRNYLERNVRRITNQVSLEARVLEVSLDDEFRLGVNWSLLPGFFKTDELGTLDSGAIVSQAAASGGGSFNFGFLDAGNFEVFVDALERQGQVRVLSSPRVATMNNVPANIRVVRQIPIIDREIIDSFGGVRTQFDIRFTEAGVNLAVVPQIGTDGTVTCQITPRITEQVGTITTPDGLQVEPILAIRETTSSVRVPDGETIVVGGLRSTSKTETLQGVPVLSSIPLLGALFRSTVQTRVEIELLVLLVPRVLDEAWRAEELRRGTHRLVALRRGFGLNSIDLEGFREEEYLKPLLDGHPRGTTQPAVRTEPPAARGSRIAPEETPLTITKRGLGDRLARRAATELDRGNAAQALALLEQAIELDATRADTLSTAALLHSRQNAHRRARDLAERACVAQPQNSAARLIAGTVAVTAGMPAAGLPSLQRAHDARKDAISACNLGAALILAGAFDDAAEVLTQHAGDADAPPELHANLSFVQLQQGDDAAALEHLERALVLGASPGNARIRALQSELQAAAPR